VKSKPLLLLPLISTSDQIFPPPSKVKILLTLARVYANKDPLQANQIFQKAFITASGILNNSNKVKCLIEVAMALVYCKD
jgi:hypothetical protein